MPWIHRSVIFVEKWGLLPAELHMCIPQGPGYCIHVRLNAKKKMTFEDDDLIMRILFIEIQIQKESLDRRGLVQPMCKQIGNSNYETKYRQQWTYTMED